MARLIEVQLVEGVPKSLTIRVGDVLTFAATGGHVQTGATVVAMLGPFLPSVIGDNGEIFTPMSAPNKIMFMAQAVGQATIDVVTGDPWNRSQTTTLTINVEA
jgi:hypothetical protein